MRVGLAGWVGAGGGERATLVRGERGGVGVWRRDGCVATRRV